MKKENLTVTVTVDYYEKTGAIKIFINGYHIEAINPGDVCRSLGLHEYFDTTYPADGGRPIREVVEV